MENLNPVRDRIPDPCSPPSISHAVATLAVAADALSKISQAIAVASKAMSDASDALSALEGLDVPTIESTTLLGNGSQENIDESLRLASRADIYSANDLGEDGTTSEYGGGFSRDGAAESWSPGHPSRGFPSYSKPMHESNNKRDPDSMPLSAELNLSSATSGVASRINNSLWSSEAVIGTKWSDVPEEYMSIDKQTSQPSAGLNHKVRPVELASLMTTCPKLPAGYNYIHLTQSSDETSVAAYLALQSTKTIFIVRKHVLTQWDFYAKIFNDITNIIVFCPDETSSFSSIEMAFNAFQSINYQVILLLPHDAFQNLPLESAMPDCIVHWGLPLDIHNYVWQLSSIQHPVRSCLMLQREQDLQASTAQHMEMMNYGIVPYPDIVLQTSFGSTSPFKKVREVSAQVLGKKGIPSYANPGELGGGTSGATRLTTTVHMPKAEKKSNLNRMPAGHYYILLDETSNSGVAPVISYIATRSKKTMCYIPVDQNIESFRGIIQYMTKLKVLAYPGGKYTKRIKSLTNAFKAGHHQIFLRPGESWTAYLTGGLVDCLIYWGVPRDIDTYLRECPPKVTHSYLIVTTSQHRQILAQRSPRGFPLTQHPSLPGSCS